MIDARVEYLDSGSQVLWEDGERVFRRGWRLDDNGKRAVLFVMPAAAQSSRSSLDHLTHEYELKNELDGAWAVRPLELVSEAGRTMLVLEDASGEPLLTLLGAPMEVGRFLRLAAGIAVSLGKLHQRGLVHKDIKPVNILIKGAANEARLTGFGIASRLKREHQPLHPPETIAGTLAYMAPEQTGRMNRSIDSRSDLYALGVTFYQMLTGALPFTAVEPMEWVHCHLAKWPVAPAERLNEIPAVVSAIVMKLVAKRPEDRYQTAAGLENDLRRCQAEWEALNRIDAFPLGEHDTPNRLLIPEKLYGRRREVDMLLAGINRIGNGGAPELILVSGYSGIGKTSLINELQPMLIPRGLFASGKFDQYKRDIPYSTLAQAFQNLMRPLLGKSEGDLARWRDALQETLGPNAGLIADLVPEVKLIIGEPPPVPELAPRDAQRRFQLVFRQFIGVFARPEHPLALFLDDLQWLDAATLDLLEDLLSRSELRNLLLIGAYRDNEVTAAHPLMRKLDAIKTAGGKVEEILLEPLARAHLAELIADALHCEPERGTPLAQLVHQKTGGNPFFAIQFISSLAEEGMLAFDHHAARWSWDLDRIHAKGYSDNVVDLLVAKLARLPAKTQLALQQMACLGNTAEVTMHAIVLGTSPDDVHAAQSEAVRQELVVRLDASYKFVHDRVQEAAYSLIPPGLRAEAHIAIGRLLAANIPAETREEAIFEIVNHLNRGASLITEPDERDQVAELNLIAGKRAKASSAYASALTYFTAGAALLPEDAWQNRQELAFELALHQTDCELCTGALLAAEERLATLASRAAGTVQRCTVAQRRTVLHTMLGAGERAVAVALECLRHVGINWSAHPTEAETRGEYERIRSRLGNRAIEDLVNLPLMQDAETLATLDLLTHLQVPALYTDENLFALSICRAANLSLESGNSDAAPAIYQALGLIAGVRFHHHKEGYRFGKMACDLLERRGLRHFGGRTYFLFAELVPWTRPLGESIDPARRSFQMAKEHGEPAFASYGLRALSSILLALGRPLEQLEREAEHGWEYVQRFGFFLDRISAPLALIRMLRGRTTKFGILDDGRFAERSFEERATGQPAQAFLESYYWIRKLQARFFAGDYASAIDAADKVETWYATAPSLSLFMLEQEEYHFYAALSRAARCEPIGPDAYAKHREALGNHRRQLQAWAEICPQNFEDHAALIEAEIARVEGRPLEAMDLYERAIVSARTNGFVHNEAIAYELAARFYAGRGFEEFAHVYLRNARQGYLRWGADGKVRQLEQVHPRLRQEERAPSQTGTIDAPVEQLDLATVIEVSQALSSEMVVERLIERFVRAAIEQAGAERAVLVAVRGEELRTSAEAAVRGNDVAVQVRQHPGGEAIALPDSLIRYSIRTRDPVVINDVMSQNPFSADPYIVKYHVRSVLCLPLINQGNLIGILYLENNLTPHVFTPGRVTVLKLLASQAAISLENSGLYRDLADREAKIRRLVDANVLGIFIWNLEGAIVEANEAFLQMLQYGGEDVVSRRLRWTDLTPAELREHDERAMAELRSTGTFRPFEKEFFRKDGSRIPVLVGGALFEGSADHGVAFVLDLSERKEAARALKQSETRYQNLFQAMAVSFFELDYTSSGQILRALRDAGVHDFRRHFKENPRLIREILRATRVVDVNDQTVALFGRGNKEELLTSVGTFWPEESLDDYAEAVLATIECNDEFSTETRVRRLDGTIFDARVTLRYATEDKTKGLAGVIDITERKRAENALRESEERFRDYAESASDWLWEMGPDHKLTMLTPNAFGSSPSARLGTTAWERALDLEAEPEKWRAIRATMDARKPFRDFVYLAPGGDGSPMYVRASGKPVFGSNGEFLGYRGVGTDATAIVRAQEALRESEHNARLIVDSIPGLVGTLAPNGEIEAVNPQILEYYGKTLEELKRSWETCIHPEDLPRVTEVLTQSIASGEPFEVEFRPRRFDGVYRWFQNRGLPLRDANGRIVRWYNLLIDLDERKRAEEALRESEQRLRSAIDGIPGLVGVLAPNGDVEAVNRQILEYTGQSPEELKNWGTNGTVHHEDLPHVSEVFGRSIAAGIPYQIEQRLRRLDGVYRWFDNRGIPIRDASGYIVRWYVLLTDIEDRTQAQARLQQMQSDFARMNRVSMMGELAASLSHEITQPIASARNNARAALNFLDKQPPDLGEVREALDSVVGNADRAGEIVDRIRENVRKAPPRKDYFDLNAAISEVIALARSAIIKNDISVQTQLAEGSSPIHGDRVQLQQVVLNLVLNAVEAMASVAAGTRDLLISTGQDRTGVRLAVRDSGPGIDPTHRERVFEAFYTTKSSGTGMGLSICRSIISAHGGQLWAEKNEPRGAVFQFTLPGEEARS